MAVPSNPVITGDGALSIPSPAGRHRLVSCVEYVKLCTVSQPCHRSLKGHLQLLNGADRNLAKGSTTAVVSPNKTHIGRTPGLRIRQHPVEEPINRWRLRRLGIGLRPRAHVMGKHQRRVQFGGK